MQQITCSHIQSLFQIKKQKSQEPKFKNIPIMY